MMPNNEKAVVKAKAQRPRHGLVMASAGKGLVWGDSGHPVRAAFRPTGNMPKRRPSGWDAPP